MNEINRRSPYWLSPGIDVPTRDEFLLLLSRRTLRGFYVDRDTGESAFVPDRRVHARESLVAYRRARRYRGWLTANTHPCLGGILSGMPGQEP